MIAKSMLTVGVVVTCVGIAAAAEAPAAGPAEPAGPMTSIGCSTSPAMTPVRLDNPMGDAVPLAGGKVEGGGGQLACCYSDPCPGWGSYKVSC